MSNPPLPSVHAAQGASAPGSGDLAPFARAQPDDARELLPEFRATYGEPFARTLDLSTWREGEGLLEGLAHLEHEIADAAQVESNLSRRVRRDWFPELATLHGAPPNAGVYRAEPENLHRVHCGLLFNGGVEACNSISVVHDTLPLSITQIGVCLVSYDGRQNSWAHRLFRRDLRARTGDDLGDLETMLTRRKLSSDGEGGEAALSELARRGVAAYAERAALLEFSSAAWRMGIGSPAPFELMSGLWASSADNLRLSLALIESYVSFGRFVFVPHANRRKHYLMLGQALRPGEYLILQSLRDDVRRLIQRGHYRDESGVRPEMERFCEETAPRIVAGLFRVWEGAPPCIFYAHVDHAHAAAHVAMADAMLQQTRGFPMLIDLAGAVCRASFGVDSLVPTAETAYAMAGDALRWVNLRGGN